MTPLLVALLLPVCGYVLVWLLDKAGVPSWLLEPGVVVSVIGLCVLAQGLARGWR